MKFWNWIHTDAGERVLRLDGPIAQKSWFGDETTPAQFETDLYDGRGDITVWLNSPGGDVVAASQIYTMLREYSGRVTVKIDGIAASAASVVAMAGDQILISPSASMMIHNPETVAAGDGEEMLRAKAMLDEVKESIINAYQSKTGLPREQIGEMMSVETWMNAHKALELGFADGILYEDPPVLNESIPLLFSPAAVTNSLINQISGGKHMSGSFEQIQAQLSDLSKQIENLNSKSPGPLLSKPGAFNTNRGTDEYSTAFWNALRGRGVSNVLSVGEDTSGGFLVPEEFSTTLVEALAEQNIFRQIARIVNTSHEKLKVPIATAVGTATWIEENEEVPESDSTFGQIILNAYKLGTLMKASSELIEDAAFNIQSYIAAEFARRIGAREEEAFCIGDGVGKPTGIFSAEGGVSIGATAAGTDTLTFDDIIDLFYSLKPPYRIRAVFVTNDSTLKVLRKIKDKSGQYIWQPAVKDRTPDTILGKPVYTSPYAPEIAAGATPMAFGDFSYYWIADRRDVRFKVLSELFAQKDQIGFFATNRVDGKLVLTEAIKLLKMGE